MHQWLSEGFVVEKRGRRGFVAAWHCERLPIVSGPIIAALVFLAVTIAVVAPLQGGTIPSTELLKGSRSNVSPVSTRSCRSRTSASAHRDVRSSSRS